MDLTITINTDNAAFADENLGSEVSRILKNYATAIESVIDPDTSWELETKLRDINGNTVGQVKFTTDWYTYESKYNGNLSRTIIPADLNIDISNKIRKLLVPFCNQQYLPPLPIHFMECTCIIHY